MARPPVPNVQSPMVDATGRVTPGWQAYLVWLGTTLASTSVSGLVNVNDFLVAGDVDYDGAFSRAFATSRSVYVPAQPLLGGPSYPITLPILIEDGMAIEGDGLGLSIIEQQTANLPVISLGQQVYAYSIRKLTVRHAGVPVAGGHGIHQGQGVLDWVNGGIIEDVSATNNWVGFDLGKAFYCDMARCNGSVNLSHGFSFNTTGHATVPSGAVGGPMQWYLTSCAAGQNAGAGYRWATTGAGFAAAPSSCGTMTDCTTFANGSFGIAAVGNVLQGIASFRVAGGFFGEDADHEIYLDTYSVEHVLKPEMIELAGGAAGSATACGINVTANNGAVYIAAGQINGCKGDGIFIQAADCQVHGGIISNNGLGGVGGRQNGVSFFGVTGMVTGARIRDSGAGTQQFGIAGTVDGVLITGCDLNGNITAPLALPAIVNTQVTGSAPKTINNITTDQLHVLGSAAFIPNAGASVTQGINVLGGGMIFTSGVAGNGITVDNIFNRFSLGVGGGPSGVAGEISFTGSLFSAAAVGGALGAGTINVSASVNLNGVPYVNP